MVSAQNSAPVRKKKKSSRRRRSKAISLKPRRIQAGAVASFMLMPQVGLSLEGFRHLIPMFIRCIAMALAVEKLIPANHPSLAYGAKGVKKVGLRALLGDAWAELRTTNATHSQWAMFSAVVLMMSLLVGSVSIFMLRLAGIGTEASAQLFAHPLDPYGQGVGVTDIQGAVEKIPVPPADTLFDMRTAEGAASQDYALMMLDKILRQGATSTHNGGAFQNALSGLMQVYNTGILVVASVIVFWMIMSVVVDTAKTGTFGGGRHNMVWAPIRVVFALGIMIPLGTQGFSSGQYMVMKLAEWGSNLGTSGYKTYMAGVIGDKSLIVPYTPDNPTAFVSSLNEVLACQAAFNTYLNQSTGSLDPAQVVAVVPKADPKNGTTSYYYTNKTAANLCGALVFAAKGQDDDAEKQITTAGSLFSNTNFASKVNTFRTGMKTALADMLEPMGPGDVVKTGQQLACGLVARRFSDGGGGADANPVKAVEPCHTVGITGADCGGDYASKDPGPSCPKKQIEAIVGGLKTAYANYGKNLEDYIKNDLVNDLAKRGWAGMGGWYQQIAAINAIIKESQQIPASIEPGDAWNASGCGWGSSAIDTATQGLTLGFGGTHNCRIPEIEQKVTEYLASDPTLLPAIKKLVQITPASNRAAIGRGLARAAQHCGPVDPKAVQSIIDFKQRLQDSSVSAGYASVDSDTSPQLPVQSAPANRSNPLFTGEWNTDVVDPFAPVPLPLEIPR